MLPEVSIDIIAFYNADAITKHLLCDCFNIIQLNMKKAISYAAWEFGFWGVSIPVCVLGYKSVTGHWPDFSDVEDQKKLGAEAFAFVNFARFAVPLRIGLALSTAPWVDENVVKKFLKRPEESEENCEVN